MQAGTHGETLRRVADRLDAEFTDPEKAELPGIGSTLGAKGGMTGILDAEDEALAVRLREVLAAIAATLDTGSDVGSTHRIKAALDSAEFVTRGELVAGNHDRVLKLIPSFVFLVVLSAADQDRALELSLRTAEMIKELG